MTYKQGENINKRFVSLSDSLRIATDSIVKLNTKHNYSMVLTGVEFQDMYDKYHYHLNASRYCNTELDRVRLALKNNTTFAAISLGIMFMLLIRHR